MGLFDFQKDHDEHALITRTQRGDTEAKNPIVTKHQPKIYSSMMENAKHFPYYFLSLIYHQVHNREPAKDLSQEVFLKAYLAINTFRFESAFYTWKPYQIAQNVC